MLIPIVTTGLGIEVTTPCLADCSYCPFNIDNLPCCPIWHTPKDANVCNACICYNGFHCPTTMFKLGNPPNIPCYPIPMFPKLPTTPLLINLGNWAAWSLTFNTLVNIASNSMAHWKIDYTWLKCKSYTSKATRNKCSSYIRFGNTWCGNNIWQCHLRLLGSYGIIIFVVWFIIAKWFWSITLANSLISIRGNVPTSSTSFTTRMFVLFTFAVKIIFGWDWTFNIQGLGRSFFYRSL